jgi:hypothetical protein
MEFHSQFQKLVSHNEDIQKLVDRGYAITFDSGWMVIRDVPYLNEHQELKWGAIATKLIPVDGNRVVQEDHTVLFAGTHPRNLDGTLIANLDAGMHVLALTEACKDVVIERRFSNKLKKAGALVAYENFYEKIESYVGIVSGPAMHLHKVTPLTFKSVQDNPAPSVFKFQDSLTTKAEISDLSMKFESEVVAVIGLGGTGAYVLDYLVKVPIKEIRGFDLDDFHVHNAYRSPGCLQENELGKKKADVYGARYANFRHGLKLSARFIDAECGADLDGVTFAFVCVDKGSSRSLIFDLLIGKGIPFIDVGMGLKRKAGPIKGMMRVTYYPPDRAQEIRDKGLAEIGDPPENLYRTNIQIAELNALNASLAVIRYKQLRGFYVEDNPYYQLLFDLLDLKTAGDLLTNED